MSTHEPQPSCSSCPNSPVQPQFPATAPQAPPTPPHTPSLTAAARPGCTTPIHTGIRTQNPRKKTTNNMRSRHPPPHRSSSSRLAQRGEPRNSMTGRGTGQPGTGSCVGTIAPLSSSPLAGTCDVMMNGKSGHRGK